MRLFGHELAWGKSVETVSTIRDKIAGLQAQIAEAEVELRAIALDAVIGGNQGAGFDAIGRLQALRAQQELLGAALQAAQDAERAERERLNERAFQAKRRALQQQAGRLQRAARALSQAEATLIEAFNEMSNAATSLVAVLPTPMQPTWRDLLTSHELWRLAWNEGDRLTRQAGGGAVLFSRHSSAGALEDRDTGALPTLASRLEGMVGQIKEGFERQAPASPPPVASPPLALSAPPSVDVPHSSTPADGEQRARELVDLRSKHEDEECGTPNSEEEIADAA
jgi:hypothetical protein